METANQHLSWQSYRQENENAAARTKSDGGRLRFDDRRPEGAIQEKLVESINSNGMTANISPDSLSTIQRARIKLRPLAIPLGDTLYQQQTKHISAYPNNNGVFHAHIFFDDGQVPGNIGFHNGGLFQDNATNYEDDTELDRLHDMDTRNAVAMNHNPGAYSLINNNCQHWVRRVIATIKKIQ